VGQYIKPYLVFCTFSHAVGGEYNAVWDEKLSLCYALVQCKCGTVVGVKIHAVQGTEHLETLVGKVNHIYSKAVFLKQIRNEIPA